MSVAKRDRTRWRYDIRQDDSQPNDIWHINGPKNHYLNNITESNELSIKIAQNFFQFNEYHHMTACIMTVRIMTVSWHNDSLHNTGQHKEN
jgi:hypothetical protein